MIPSPRGTSEQVHQAAVNMLGQPPQQLQSPKHLETTNTMEIGAAAFAQVTHRKRLKKQKVSKTFNIV